MEMRGETKTELGMGSGRGNGVEDEGGDRKDGSGVRWGTGLGRKHEGRGGDRDRNGTEGGA